MLKLFPSTKKVYYFLSFSTLLISLGIFMGIISRYENLFWPVFLIWFILLFLLIILINILMEFAATNRYRKQVLSRFQCCAVGEYIGLVNQMLLRQPKSKRTQNLLSLQLSSAYLALGAPAEAQPWFAPFPLERSHPIEAGYNACYYNNLTISRLMFGDIEGAKRSLEEMKQCLTNGQIRENERATYAVHYTQKLCLLHMEENQFDGAKQIFQTALDMAQTPLEKVTSSYQLARVYLRENDEASAEKSLAYVADFGGDTRYAQWARAYLAHSPGLPTRLPI